MTNRRHKTYRYVTALFVLVLALAGGCQSKNDDASEPLSNSDSPDPPVVVFAVDPTWPPMEFENPDGEMVGFSIDYITAAGQLAGFEPVFRKTAWDGIFEGLSSGEYDAVCSSVSITENRKARMDFSRPYFRVRQAVLVLAESEVETLTDLAGRGIGTQVATTGTEAVGRIEGAQGVTYPNIGLAVEDLIAGRIDAVVCDDPVAADYALNRPEYRDRLRIAEVIESGKDEYYGVALPKGSDLLPLIDRGLEAVQRDGIDRELVAEWIRQ